MQDFITNHTRWIFFVGSVAAVGLFLFFSPSVFATDTIKGSLFQIENPSINVESFAQNASSTEIPIVASDDPAYDFMARSPGQFTVYFKRDPFDGSDNVAFKTSQGSIAFQTLSSIDDGAGSLGYANLEASFRSARSVGNSYKPTTAALGHVRNGSPGILDYPAIEADASNSGLDADYMASPERLLEEVVLNAPDDISSVSQEFTVNGVYPEMEPDGSISFITDGFSEFPLAFRIPAPVMYEEGRSNIRNYGLHYELQQLSAGTYKLTKVIDPAGKAWLFDSGRAYPVVIDATVVYGSGASYNSAATNYMTVAPLSGSTFVVGYENGTSNGNAIVGTVSGSGSTISYGTAATVNATATTYAAVGALSSSSFVMVYASGTASFARIGNVSGTAISFGAAVSVNASATTYLAVAGLNATSFVLGYASGTTAGVAKVGLITGTSTITLGTAATINATTTNYVAAAALSSTTFVFGFESKTTSASVIAGTVAAGSSTITLGTAVSFSAAAANGVSISSPSATTFVVSYANSTGNGVAVAGSVATRTITLGAVATFDAATNIANTSIAALGSASFVITYTKGTAASNANALIGSITSTSTLSYGTSTVFNGGATSTLSDFAVANLGADSFVTTYENGTASGQAAIGILNPALSFSISTTTLSFGSLTTAHVYWATSSGGQTSEPSAGSPVTVTVSSSGKNGLFVSAMSKGNGTAAGLYNAMANHLIAATSAGSVLAGAEGYALYVKNVGSALTSTPSFYTSTATGTVSTSPQTILSAAAGGIVTMNNSADIAIKAAIATNTAAGSYSDVISLTVTGKY